MRLFLVRHGETVDNVAGLYAGSRDSALTSHGVLQAKRLAAHLSDGLPISHVFCSDLQRAVKTAEAICQAQHGDVAMLQNPELREKDFGRSEGTSWLSKRNESAERSDVDDAAETAQSMASRVNSFLDSAFLDVLNGQLESDRACVIVAHGIILGVLVRALTSRLIPGSLTVSPEARPSGEGGPMLVHIPWSNTGFLEASLTWRQPSEDQDEPLWSRLSMHVVSINSTAHLKGLRKTRGGIGSAQHDAKQKTMDSFFGPARAK